MGHTGALYQYQPTRPCLTPFGFTRKSPLNARCATDREHWGTILAQHIGGNLGPAPAHFEKWQPTRGPLRIFDIRGIRFRYGSLKPREVIATLAPPCGHPLVPVVYPSYPWCADPALVHYNPVMNVQFLAKAIPAALADIDPQLGEYLRLSYLHGFDSRSRLPLDSVRLVARNRAIVGSTLGGCVDDMLTALEDQGSLLSLSQPLPGTVVLPVNADISLKYTGGPHGLPKLKMRDTIDPMSPRHDRSGPGHWSHPEDRLFTSTTIYEVMVICAEHDVEKFTAKDFARAFSKLVLRPDNAPRNAIFWWRESDGEWRWHYLLAAVFGMNPTPAMFFGHAFGVQCAISQRIDKRLTAIAGAPVHIPSDTNCDDFLFLFPRHTARFSEEVEQEFDGFCKEANLEISHPKSVIARNRVRYDGFHLVAGMFPNEHGVTSVGIGLDIFRCFKIRMNITRALRGLRPRKALSVLGLLRWTHPVMPHSRALLESYNAGVHACGEHQTYAPQGEARADLQRLLNVFRRPVMVPVHLLLCLTEPRRTVWTDASGTATKSYEPHLGGWDDSPTSPWFYSLKVPPRLRVTSEATMSKEQLTNSTTHLELLAFYVLLLLAGKWYCRRNYFSLRWYTDSKAGADAWRLQHSHSPAVNSVLKLMSAHCSKRRIYVEAVFVPRAQNQAADLLTHDDVVQFCRLTGVPPSARVPADSILLP